MIDEEQDRTEYNLGPKELWQQTVLIANQVIRMHRTGNMVGLDHASSELSHMVFLLENFRVDDSDELEFRELEISPQSSTLTVTPLTDSMVVDVTNVADFHPILPSASPIPPITPNLTELLFRMAEYIEALDESGTFAMAFTDEIVHEYRRAFLSKLTESRDSFTNRAVHAPSIKYVCASCKCELNPEEFRNHKCEEDSATYMVPELFEDK